MNTAQQADRTDNIFCILALNAKLFIIMRADGNINCIIAFLDILHRHISADGNIRNHVNACCQNMLDIALQNLLRQTIIRDTIAKHATQLGTLLINRNLMPHLRQIIRRRQPAGTTADNADGFACFLIQDFRRLCLCVIHRKAFQTADIDGIIHHRAATVCFTGMHADIRTGGREGVVLPNQLNPVMKFLERHLMKLLEPRMKSKTKAKKMSRGVAIAGAWVFLGGIVVLLIAAIVPSIIQSIQGIATGLPSEVKNIMDWSDEFFKGDSEIVGVINDVLQKASDAVQKFLENDLLAQVQVYLTSIASGVIYTLKFLLNLVVGIIVSIYVLASQETFAGQAKKIIYAMFKPVRANVIVETVRKSNEIFGGFISGKLLDSAIIGILAYVVLTIMRMPDTILLAVIIGVTNIIPFFGPFIGAIPSFLIVVLQNPLQGVYFLIFIFILQQIDGNIIGPKILGDSTGLSSFWVVFAILVFGGLWGFPGMLLGVPLMAVIYYVAQKLVSYFLRKRGLVDDTGSYIHLMRIDKRTNELVYEEKTEKGTEEKIEESPEK